MHSTHWSLPLPSPPLLLVQLSEVWSRELQVLPGRTHPLMNMHGASGFVLAGYKVQGGVK
jgi:tRNA (adenine58-N1)-methyltransferase non-catalytic subunit